jgi:NitT/TauT family transport system substrate-binding protein
MNIFRLSVVRTRRLLAGMIAAVALSATAHAAGPTTVRFALDWRFEGPGALFLLPDAKGYFRDENLNVSIDAGSGSGATVARVASGTYDMGFADLAALMEFHANNPTVPNKPVAVMMVYNNMPAAVFSLKKSGIESPQDLTGKKLGAPVFDSGRKSWPIFAQANEVGDVEWVSMDPPLRETMLVRGDVDAITGFYFTSLLNLEARGAKPEDIAVLRYADHGVRLYGNVIIASERFIEQNPEAVTAFLRAFARGTADVIADPTAAIQYVRQRDGIINVDLEERRLRLALESSVVTPDAIAEGFGRIDPPRLALMASQVSDAFQTENRVDPDVVWTDRFLPDAATLDVLGQ